MLSRREAITVLATGTAALLGCASGDDPDAKGSSRLTARPSGIGSSRLPGIIPLGLGGARDGFLYAPPEAASLTPIPLMLALHGAGGSAAPFMALMQPHAQRLGFLLLGVDSRATTWDGISGRFDGDVKFINRALQFTFARYNVDPALIVSSGFSDGASYALALGLTNGDLFRKIVAFSPGFIPESDTALTGTPDIYISHGENDQVLDIDTTSRAIVPFLRGRNYDVTYTEFSGGHAVPEEICVESSDWMMDDG